VGEEYCRLFGQLFGLETVTLRYFNVFGPRQDPDSPYAAVIPIFLKRLLAGEPPPINGDGTQTRDFTFVANVVAANLAACRTPGASGVYNIACGGRTSVNELLAHLQRALGTRIEPVHGPARAGDVPHSVADITRARTELGYAPQVEFGDGIDQTVAYYLSQAH
jgi:nucleoside-diphosphate-sugar epimerase